MRDIRLGFLASGEGTSIEALVRKIQSGELKGFEATVVICNRPEGEAGVYAWAEGLGLPIRYSPFSLEQLEIFKEYGVDMVLALGYIRKVGNRMLDHFGNRIWNVHQSLLPRHGGSGMYGLAPHQAVIDSGDSETGATIHIMGSNFDTGKILGKVEVPVIIGETAEQLQRRVLPFEYALVAKTLRLYRDGLLANCKMPSFS